MFLGKNQGSVSSPSCHIHSKDRHLHRVNNCPPKPQSWKTWFLRIKDVRSEYPGTSCPRPGRWHLRPVLYTCPAACVWTIPLLRQADRQVNSAQESTKRAVFLGLNVMVLVAKIHVLNGTLSMRTCLLRSMCSDEGAMCFGVMSNSCSTQHPKNTATKHHGPGPLRAQNRFSI